MVLLWVNSPFFKLLVGAKCLRCPFLKDSGFGHLTFGFGPNPNTNLFQDSVSDLTSKPATDSDLRPNPKDSVKSTTFPKHPKHLSLALPYHNW